MAINGFEDLMILLHYTITRNEVHVIQTHLDFLLHFQAILMNMKNGDPINFDDFDRFVLIHSTC